MKHPENELSGQGKNAPSFRAGDLLAIYEDALSWYSVDDDWADGGILVEHSYAVFLEDVKLQNEDRTFIKVLVSRGVRVVLKRYVRKCL